MNAEQYQKICEACDRILLSPDSSIERVAINWLHVLNEHPSNLAQYAKLFGFQETTIRKILTTTINFLLAIGRLLPRKYAKQDLSLLPKSEVLIISHLLNAQQALEMEDFYFGQLPEILASKDVSVVVALRDHIGLRKYDGGLLSQNINSSRVLLEDVLSWFEELKLKKKLINEAVLLRQAAKRALNPFDRLVYEAAAEKATDPSSIATLRLYSQVQKMVKASQPTSVLTTYEGHAWSELFLQQRDQLIHPLSVLDTIMQFYFPVNMLFIAS